MLERGLVEVHKERLWAPATLTEAGLTALRELAADRRVSCRQSASGIYGRTLGSAIRPEVGTRPLRQRKADIHLRRHHIGSAAAAKGNSTTAKESDFSA
jgi:hypothetical protein